MKCFLIYDEKNPVSVAAANQCKQSTKLDIEMFQQTSPDTLKEHLVGLPPMSWTYPLNDQFGIDRETGMILRPYKTNSMAKKFACTVSHARLWKKCIELREEIMILEHDAIFTREFDNLDWEGGALGLNDPRGSTHSSQYYHEQVSALKTVKEAPWVARELDLPQGLAGNSAYIIRPHFAQKLLDKLKQVGAWPNDAIMCKQFFPGELKVVCPYYTKVQGIQSTTVL